VANLFLALSVASGVCGVTASICMVSYLSTHNVPINYLFIRLFILRYVTHYRIMTANATGKTGAWYYVYIFAMMLALVFALAGILLKFTDG